MMFPKKLLLLLLSLSALFACSKEERLQPENPAKYVQQITDAFLMLPADIFDTAKVYPEYEAERGWVRYEFDTRRNGIWKCRMTGKDSYIGSQGVFDIEATDVKDCYHIAVSGTHKSGDFSSTFSADIDERKDKRMVMRVELSRDGSPEGTYEVSYKERGDWTNPSVKRL